MADVKITDNTDKFKAAMDEGVLKALEAIGIHIEGEAKRELENDPRRVDTGLLRNSITHAVSGEPAAISSYSSDNGEKSGTYSGSAPDERKGEKAVYVGTNVEYGVYVHEGTQRMAANRFLKNAVERNKDQIKEYIENTVKDKLKNV